MQLLLLTRSPLITCISWTHCRSQCTVTWAFPFWNHLSQDTTAQSLRMARLAQGKHTVLLVGISSILCICALFVPMSSCIRLCNYVWYETISCGTVAQSLRTQSIVARVALCLCWKSRVPCARVCTSQKASLIYIFTLTVIIIKNHTYLI